MKIKKIRVVAKLVGKPLETIDLKNSLESFQKFVGGYIQQVPVAVSGELVDSIYLICDEDGRQKDLPLNAKVSARMPALYMVQPDFIIDLTGQEHPAPGEMGYHDIRGNFFLTRINKKGEYCGLTDSDINQII